MVSVEKCEKYDKSNVLMALEKTFRNLGGIERYITPGMKVVLKPNLVMRKRPDDAATTHPVLVEALSEMILKCGASVTIADSPGGLYNARVLKSIYSGTGMETAAGNSGAVLNYDLSEIDIENPEGRLLKRVMVIKPLIDADIVINLPKLKTHGQMVYTGAVKNMFGAIPGALKAEYHYRMSDYDDFANALIDIFLSVKPTLNIMDAVWGMEGYGPTAGNPRHIGVIAASENAFELDMVCLDIINADPSLVPVFKNAIARGLCPSSIKEIEIKGEDIKSLKINDFDIPQMDSLQALQFFRSGLMRGVARFITSKLKLRPVFDYGKCAGCSDCARFCPAHVIDMSEGKPRVNLKDCIGCFCCQELCPAKAVSIKRPAIVNFLLKIKKH